MMRQPDGLTPSGWTKGVSHRKVAVTFLSFYVCL